MSQTLELQLFIYDHTSINYINIQFLLNSTYQLTSVPLPYQKNVQKLDTKCIQRLYKSTFCMIMNVQKMHIKFLHIYKKCTNCTKLVKSSD